MVGAAICSRGSAALCEEVEAFWCSQLLILGTGDRCVRVRAIRKSSARRAPRQRKEAALSCLGPCEVLPWQGVVLGAIRGIQMHKTFVGLPAAAHRGFRFYQDGSFTRWVDVWVGLCPSVRLLARHCSRCFPCQCRQRHNCQPPQPSWSCLMSPSWCPPQVWAGPRRRCSP